MYDKMKNTAVCGLGRDGKRWDGYWGMFVLQLRSVGSPVLDRTGYCVVVLGASWGGVGMGKGGESREGVKGWRLADILGGKITAYTMPLSALRAM